jgi:hypothetical protein
MSAADRAVLDAAERMAKAADAMDTGDYMPVAEFLPLEAEWYEAVAALVDAARDRRAVSS